MLGPFGILGWIRTGDGMPNAFEFVIFVDFRGFWPLGLKLLFLGNSAFFRTLRLGLISAKPYYQNARIDRGIIFGFRRNLRNDCKLPVRSGFLGVSLISVFSLYFINLSGTLCWPPPLSYMCFYYAPVNRPQPGPISPVLG